MCAAPNNISAFKLEHCGISSNSKHWTSLAPLIFYPIWGNKDLIADSSSAADMNIERKPHKQSKRGGKAGGINIWQRCERKGNRLLMEWVSIIALLLRRAGVLGWKKTVREGWMCVCVCVLSLWVGRVHPTESKWGTSPASSVFQTAVRASYVSDLSIENSKCAPLTWMFGNFITET